MDKCIYNIVCIELCLWILDFYNIYIMCNIDINLCEFYEERKKLNERIIFLVFK